MSAEHEIGACPVAAVMGTELFTLSPDTAVSSARRLVLENDIDHMLVLDSEGTLAGILCKADLHSADRNGRVEDCMTSPVVCITPDTTLQEAIDIMGANDIDCLPVVTGSFLVGMVTWNGLALAELTPRVFDVEAVEVETTARGLLPPGDRPREPSDGADACASCGELQQIAFVRELGRLPLCARCRHRASFHRAVARA